MLKAAPENPRDYTLLKTSLEGAGYLTLAIAAVWLLDVSFQALVPQPREKPPPPPPALTNSPVGTGIVLDLQLLPLKDQAQGITNCNRAFKLAETFPLVRQEFSLYSVYIVPVSSLRSVPAYLSRLGLLQGHSEEEKTALYYQLDSLDEAPAYSLNTKVGKFIFIDRKYSNTDDAYILAAVIAQQLRVLQAVSDRQLGLGLAEANTVSASILKQFLDHKGQDGQNTESAAKEMVHIQNYWNEVAVRARRERGQQKGM
jgi:hypothetical protein